MRSLDQWLEYQARVHPHSIDLGLERLCEVLTRLHWRQPNIPVVTVAGTNGKGSVSAYCAAMLRAAGHRVGVFTSPHLRDYRERIQIHDRWVSAAELVAAFDRIETARGEVGLTFFEFNTLAALLVFEDAQLDAWVLEVGMGGRLDAVNVVDPDVCVVVSVGLDHQEYLGTTLEAIAREKAGIFRSGCAAVLGSRDMPPAVEQVARSVGATLKRLGLEFEHTPAAATWSYRSERWLLPALPAPALKGATQFDNAATALAALEEITTLENAAAHEQGAAVEKVAAIEDRAATNESITADGRKTRLRLSATAVAQGLSSVRLTARFQLIAPAAANAPAWILDVAHNPAAARVLAANLRDSPCAARTLAVCGILADKDAAEIAAALSSCIDAWWCASTDGERGQSGAQLAETVRGRVAGTVGHRDSPAAACAAALDEASGGDRIVVFGSFHTIGPALDWLEAHDLLPTKPLSEYTAAPRPT